MTDKRCFRGSINRQTIRGTPLIHSLGHKSSKTTEIEIYTHVSNKDIGYLFRFLKFFSFDGTVVAKNILVQND